MHYLTRWPFYRPSMLGQHFLTFSSLTGCNRMMKLPFLARMRRGTLLKAMLWKYFGCYFFQFCSCWKFYLDSAWCSDWNFSKANICMISELTASMIKCADCLLRATAQNKLCFPKSTKHLFSKSVTFLNSKNRWSIPTWTIKLPKPRHLVLHLVKTTISLLASSTRRQADERYAKSCRRQSVFAPARSVERGKR